MAGHWFSGDSLAALVLVDRGKLDLDANVAKYRPEFGPGARRGRNSAHAGGVVASPAFAENACEPCKPACRLRYRDPPPVESPERDVAGWMRRPCHSCS